MRANQAAGQVAAGQVAAGQVAAGQVRESVRRFTAAAGLFTMITLAGTMVSFAGGGLTGTARAAYLGSEGRIAFVRNGDIYSITPSGSGLRLLARGGRDFGPRWSPSGRKLAYLDAGNLWIMNANGSHKRQITSAAPGQTDGRPSWSPSGRYLAFVLSARHARHGFLTRYDTTTGHFETFTTTISPHGLIKVPALPGTAVAWQRALTGSKFGYFLAYEGTGLVCQPHWFCLDLLGFGQESGVTNGFPSVEDSAPAPARMTDPDWYPVRPAFYKSMLTTVESCTSSGCTHSGLQLLITSPLILPGAYEGVYSPLGAHIAFVRSGRRGPRIYTEGTSPAVRQVPHLLTTGTEPDWQPIAPFPPA